MYKQTILGNNPYTLTYSRTYFLKWWLYAKCISYFLYCILLVLHEMFYCYGIKYDVVHKTFIAKVFIDNGETNVAGLIEFEYLQYNYTLEYKNYYWKYKRLVISRGQPAQ